MGPMDSNTEFCFCRIIEQLMYYFSKYSNKGCYLSFLKATIAILTFLGTFGMENLFNFVAFFDLYRSLNLNGDEMPEIEERYARAIFGLELTVFRIFLV